MPRIWRKSGGTWQPIKTVYRKTGGSWQSVRRIWRKTAGAWQLVFQQSITPDIQTQVEITLTTANSTTQTKKLTGKLYHWTNASGVTYNFAKGSGDNLPATFTNISGASGTSTNPASGSSNTNDTYTLTQSDMIQNATNWFIYVSKATNSTYGTEQTSASYPVTFDMPRDIYTLATGTITRNSIALSWTPTVGSGSYAVYYGTSPSPTTLFTTTTASSVTVTGLASATLYYFRILPWTGSSGNGYYGSYSNEVSAQTPVAPGNLTSVQHFNFTGNNLQLFLTTGTNTNSIQYKFIPTTFSGFEIGPFTQSVTSSRPYKFEHNLMSYFTLRTWNEDTYLSTTRYYQYNTAWYAGNEYQAKLVSFSGASTAPSIGASNRYWTLGTVVGTYPYTPHTWSSGNTYTQGNTVYYGSTVFNSPVYQYTANDPGFEAVTPTNTSYWTKITTVNYNKGDYIYRASTSTYYFAKDYFNGYYPTNTTYWQSNYLLWYAQITPYNSSVDGNMYDSSGTYVTIVRADGQPSEPLNANISNAAVSFSSIAQTTASASFTPSYANRVFFYLRPGTSGGTAISGYNPLTVSTTPYNQSTVNITGLTADTNYNADATARYVYNDTYGIYHDGFTTPSATFKTLAVAPTTPTSVVVKSFGSNQGTIFLTAQANTGSVQGWLERTYFVGGLENVDSITNYINITNGDAGKILITGSNSSTATYTGYVQAWTGSNKTGTLGTLASVGTKTLNGSDAMSVSGFTLSSSSTTSLTITWNGTGAVNVYRARLYRTSDNALMEDKGYSLYSGSVTFNGLAQGTAYYLVVNPRYEYTSSVYEDGTQGTSTSFSTTSPNLTAPSIYYVSPPTTSGGPISVYFTGGSGPYYQIWWTVNSDYSTVSSFDATDQYTSSPMTDSTGPTYSSTWYVAIRSVSNPSNTGTGPSSTISSWSTPYQFTTSFTVIPTGGSVSLSGGNTVGSIITASTSAGSWNNSPTSYDVYITTALSPNTPTSSDSRVASSGGSTSVSYSIPSSAAIAPVNLYRAFATASNSAGTSSPPVQSSTVITTQQAASGTAPATPTNGGGTYSTGSTYITNATFTRSASGTTPITYYWSVYRETANGSTSGSLWNSGSFSSSTLGGTATIPQQSWSNGTTYNWARYEVYASNSVNTSGTLRWWI